ncbi:MAG: homoserine dehydrogenase [Burkholderiaceae bacterium]
MEKFGPVRVGLLGVGTVGTGTLDVLTQSGAEITRRAGRRIEITQACARNQERAMGRLAGRAEYVADPMAIVMNPEIDIIVELVGGEQQALELVMAAIDQGKHVVTANKALLALHGNEIFAAASAKGVMVAFEAAVAGGIPIIKALREGLSANRIESVAGIINGTTNYILSEMRDHGSSFADVLRRAQELGFAEADPTFDIEGVDAAHKLALIAAIAFGVPVQFDRCHTEGINGLDGQDIEFAEKLGYRIKLLAMARSRSAATDSAELKPGIELRVHPTLVPARRLLANVEGPMNAVWVRGDAVGETLYYGQGAGAMPTASAVVADLVDVARTLTADPDHRVPHLAFQADSLADSPILPMDETETAYYLRLAVTDEPGVLADITRFLADAGISLESVLQPAPDEQSGNTTIILLTHRTIERRMNEAIDRIQALNTVTGRIVRIRLEDLT